MPKLLTRPEAAFDAAYQAVIEVSGMLKCVEFKHVSVYTHSLPTITVLNRETGLYERYESIAEFKRGYVL